VLQAAIPECVTTGCSNIPFYTAITNSLVRKNGQEMKEGARVLITGVICQNVDNSGGQNGVCFVDAVRSISGGSGQNYFVTEHDVTVKGMILRNLCNGFTDTGGRSAGVGSGNGVSFQQNNLSFLNSLGYNITNTNPGCGTASFGMEIDNAGQNWNVIANENAGGTSATLQGFASADAGVTVIAASAPASCVNHSGSCTTYAVNYSPSGAAAQLAANQLVCGGSTGGAYVYVYGFTNSGNNSPAGSGGNPPTGFLCDGATTAGAIALVNGGGVTESLASLAAEAGTVTLSSTSASVTGSMTSFSSAWVGTSLVATSGSCAGDSQFIASVLSPTSLTLTGNFPVSCTGVSFSVGCSICKPGTAVPLQNNANPIVNNTYISNVATVGYQVADMALGDPVAVSGCTTAAFSSPAYTVGHFLVPAGVGPGLTTASGQWVAGSEPITAINGSGSIVTVTSTLGPLADGTVVISGAPVGFNGTFTVVTSGPTQFTYKSTATGSGSGGVAAANDSASAWTSSMLTVAYNWTAAGSTSDLTGTCLMTNVQGGPKNITWNHQTLITDSTASIHPVSTPGSSGINYMQSAAVLNSIFTTGCNPSPSCSGGLANAGWYNPNSNYPQEGTKTELINYDVTSLSAWGLVWASSYGNTPRTNSLYSEFPNNSSFPETTPPFTTLCSSSYSLPNGATTVGCSPPTLNWSFPAGACAIGFNVSCSGMGSTVQLPLTTSDYHSYALASTSPFHGTAPDGSGDYGAIISGSTYSIDSLQTANIYVCATSCGSAGPYPDVP
jgi:hypothetical protein